MTFLLISLAFVLIGWLIKVKKATWLISGYNTASKERKEQYDVDKLCHYFGNFMFTLAGIYFLMSMGIFFLAPIADIIIWIGFILSAVVIVLEIIYMNSGNRIRK